MEGATKHSSKRKRQAAKPANDLGDAPDEACVRSLFKIFRVVRTVPQKWEGAASHHDLPRPRDSGEAFGCPSLTPGVRYPMVRAQDIYQPDPAPRRPPHAISVALWGSQ